MSWQEVPLGAVCDIYDGPHGTPSKTTDGPWYLSISSLTNGRLSLSESAHLSWEDFPKWTRRVQPQPGDTLFSYETRIGESAFWNLPIPAALGRRMGLLRPNANVEPRFLAYAYRSPQFQAELAKRTIQGATVNRIAIGEMSGWPISIPSVDEQRRISEVLGALDDLVSANERVSNQLRRLLAASADAASRRARASVRLGDVANVRRVKTSGQGDTPYLGLEHFGEAGVGIVGTGRLADVSGDQQSFTKGDLLYGRLRPYFRKVDRPGFSGACSGEIWVVTFCVQWRQILHTTCRGEVRSPLTMLFVTVWPLSISSPRPTHAGGVTVTIVDDGPGICLSAYLP
ncbi:MAG: restriction endonuclease subunit S [Microbacteriaceae bacterium]